MATSRKETAKHKRVVIKIGSALLVDRKDGLKAEWLTSLCEDIARLREQNIDVLVVSSGAIAMGRSVLSITEKRLKLEESQACAAIGQIALARAWSEKLSTHDIVAGQLLLTLYDTEERRRYLNARATTTELLNMNCVPIINENDTVATSEIRYGDNDRLAARVATMIGADLLILLSDVDGLYTASPSEDRNADFLDTIDAITPEIEAMAGDAGSELSRGGMRTKIDAAKIATNAGCAMIIASGQRQNPITAIDNGARSSWFSPAGTPRAARATWIAGQLEPAGAITIDDGAVDALKRGRSLLPAGIKSVSGTFGRGDNVSVIDMNGNEIARGLAAYDAVEAKEIAGFKTTQIEDKLGYSGRSAMIHRDDLVMMQAKENKAG
ncbi:glutamate 5-kinase [Lentilitoribacter sp. EG35]|jgi:glutamate 5-kinase|uniref:glutamate 5-kinase n=1 Tax=Lentilitoribacter sp. EG35 TaxID=3234192 RepID=UPI003461128E